MDDPYLIPGTHTLINKFGIQDPKKLQDLESAIYFQLKISDHLPEGDFDYNHLKNIHQYLFGELYNWAGQERTIDIIKGHSHFARKEFIEKELNKLFLKLKNDQYLQNLNHTDFCKKLSFYFTEINAAHPFREGNGRSLRTFLELLSKKAGYKLAWEAVDTKAYIQATISGFKGDYKPIEKMFEKIASTLVHSQEIEAYQDKTFSVQPKSQSTVLNTDLTNTEQEWVVSIVASSVSVSGTLAEIYLKEHLGITDLVLDESFKFNPSVFEPETKKNYPALVVIARNEKREVEAVHCIYLDKKTANELKGKTPKRTYGVLVNAAVFIQSGDTSNQFVLAEGPENALSVAQSNKALSVWATLSAANFGRTSIPTGSTHVLLCVNQDSIEATSKKRFTDAVQTLSERGLNVWCANPIDCKGFNEVLKKQGIDEVKRLIDNKILIKKALTLGQLIENKNSLVSDTAKIIVEFDTKYRKHKNFGEPKTKAEVEKKGFLFDEVGKLATLIKNDNILKEAAQRHKIERAVFSSEKDYIEQQKWSSEAKNLMETIKTNDPIKDYLEAIEQKDKIPSPWQTNSKPEKDHWNRLNNKIHQLAFMIDKNPFHQYAAKEMGIYEKIKRHSFQLQNKIAQKLSLEQGRGIKL